MFGLAAVGGLGVGLWTVAGVAIGWYAAVGGLAVAHELAIGGAAFGQSAYGGWPNEIGSLKPLHGAPFRWSDSLTILAVLIAVLLALARRVQRHRHPTSPDPTTPEGHPHVRS